MTNELIINHSTSATLYALLFDATGQVWNGSTFVSPVSATWTDYDIAMAEVATATGIYRASMPAAAAGVYSFVVRKQAGASPAVGDAVVGAGQIQWDGSAEVTLSSRAVPTDIVSNGAITTLAGAVVQTNSVSGSVGSVTSGVTLADDAITSAKFDESTAFPVKFADTGSTKIARVGADSDTLETLSDQLDAIQLVTDAIDTSAVTVTSTNDAGVLTITRGVTFAATVSGLVISATWTKLYFTLKESDYDDDDDAIVQIVETNPAALTDGLLYLDSAAIVAPITVADGTLTVNQAGGTVAIAITDNATAHLAKASGLVWDIKTKDAAGATVQNATGTASIVRAITQTI